MDPATEEKRTPSMRVTRATTNKAKKTVSFAAHFSKVRRSLIFDQNTPPNTIADVEGGRRSSKRKAAKDVGSMREPSLNEKLRRI